MPRRPRAAHGLSRGGGQECARSRRPGVSPGGNRGPCPSPQLPGARPAPGALPSARRAAGGRAGRSGAPGLLPRRARRAGARTSPRVVTRSRALSWGATGLAASPTWGSPVPWLGPSRKAGGRDTPTLPGHARAILPFPGEPQLHARAWAFGAWESRGAQKSREPRPCECS